MLSISHLQSRLDDKFFGEMQITTEALTAKAISEGKLRVANYGGESEYGSTYFVGTLEQVEQYVNSIV